MSAKKIDEDADKVMDVSAPGKGKILTTSRPIVTPLAGKETGRPITEINVAQSPSTSHKIIQPLGGAVDESEHEPKADDNISEPEQDQPAEANAQTEHEEANQEQKPETEKIVDEPAPEEEKPAEDSPPPAPEKSDEEDSDSAGVDELAKSVETKKDAAKKAEEAAKKDAELQKLIDSGKYVVPIGKDSSHRGASQKHHEAALLLFILLIALVVGTYLAVDAGILDIGYDVPYEIIKD